MNQIGSSLCDHRGRFLLTFGVRLNKYPPSSFFKGYTSGEASQTRDLIDHITQFSGEVPFEYNLLTEDPSELVNTWTGENLNKLFIDHPALMPLFRDGYLEMTVEPSAVVPANGLPLPEGNWQHYEDPSGNGEWYELQAKACKVYIEQRPAYCDRGRWLAKVEPQGSMKDILALSLDSQDRFPRYYFHLLFAALEVEAFLKRRGQWPKSEEENPDAEQ